jgi:hypothetical protein
MRPSRLKGKSPEQDLVNRDIPDTKGVKVSTAMLFSSSSFAVMRYRSRACLLRKCISAC